MAFLSTGSGSFLCAPRPGMLGNQCTALIKALTSCLYRKESVTRSLLISCRFQSVCEIVLPIKTCLSMKTSTRMWAYLYVICCWDWIMLCDKCSVRSSDTWTVQLHTLVLRDHTDCKMWLHWVYTKFKNIFPFNIQFHRLSFQLAFLPFILYSFPQCIDLKFLSPLFRFWPFFNSHWTSSVRFFPSKPKSHVTSSRKDISWRKMKWSANNKLDSSLLQTISTWCSSWKVWEKNYIFKTKRQNPQ